MPSHLCTPQRRGIRFGSKLGMTRFVSFAILFDNGQGQRTGSVPLNKAEFWGRTSSPADGVGTPFQSRGRNTLKIWSSTAIVGIAVGWQKHCSR